TATRPTTSRSCSWCCELGGRHRARPGVARASPVALALAAPVVDAGALQTRLERRFGRVALAERAIAVRALAVASGREPAGARALQDTEDVDLVRGALAGAEVEHDVAGRLPGGRLDHVLGEHDLRPIHRMRPA